MQPRPTKGIGRSGSPASAAGVLASIVALTLLAALMLAACGGGSGPTITPSATHTATIPAVTPTTPTEITVAATGEEHPAMLRANPERTGVYPSGGPTRRPKLLWTFKTTSVAGMEFISSPVIAEGVAYVGSGDGRLYAVDVQSGHLKWRFKTGDWVRCPAVSNEVVYVGSHDGSLYALHAKSGREKWEFRTWDAIFSSPAVSHGVVYVGSEDGALYALDAASGEKRWEFHTDAEISSSPAVSDGVVYIGSHDGSLYALDAQSGRPKWEFKAGGPVSTEAAIAGDVVYVGSDDGHLHAVDIRSGQEKWRFDAGGTLTIPAGRFDVRCCVTSPAVAGGTAYVGSDDGHLYAVDVQNGVEKWKFWAGRGYFGVRSSPVLSGDVVYFGSGAPHRALHALDATTGRELWAFTAGGEVDDSPAISDGVVYFTDLAYGPEYGSDSPLVRGRLYAVK